MKIDEKNATHDKSFINWLKSNFRVKSLSSDDENSFKFKTSNWYLTIIYLVSFIVIPIIYSFVKRYGFNIIANSNDEFPKPWDGLDFVFFALIPILGMSLTFLFGWKIMKNGGWAAYSHILFGFFSSIFVSIFLIAPKVITKDSPMYFTVQFLVQLLFQLLGSILVILSSKQLRTQIWTTIKEAKLNLITWIVIALAFAYVLQIIFTEISNTYQSSEDSANQARLIELLSSRFGILVFVLGTIFLAPINEEISYRYGTFKIVSNKWIAYVASLIYFPSMHVMQHGDWNNILSYMGMAIVFPSLFVFTRGNSTYNIGLHMAWNTIAAIVTLVQHR